MLSLPSMVISVAPLATCWPTCTGTLRTIPGKRALIEAKRLASTAMVPISCTLSRMSAGPACSTMTPASLAACGSIVVRPS
ncbi:hypothetical protein D3C81_1615810 [compost metagenome]